MEKHRNSVPTLIRTRIKRLRQPLEEISEFEKAVCDRPDWPSVHGLPGMPLWLLKVVSRFVRLLALVIDRLLRVMNVSIDRNFLCIGYSAPHYMVYKSFPYFCIPSRTRMVWLYDAWESKLPEIENALRAHRINIGFVSSLQATEYLNGRGIERFLAYWVPEAVTVSDYDWKPLNERKIDVLQMGRRWDAYHDAIHNFSQQEELVYLYEKQPNEIIFPTRTEFINALARSKISICVPSSITHPARSGKIATMTWRYLQSMAAKCLVLGRMPEEVKQLFDYEPIIEIDMSDPCGQLAELVENYSSFEPLIEKNYQFVQRYHQWPNRIQLIQEGLNDFEQKFPSV